MKKLFQFTLVFLFLITALSAQTVMVRVYGEDSTPSYSGGNCYVFGDNVNIHKFPTLESVEVGTLRIGFNCSVMAYVDKKNDIPIYDQASPWVKISEDKYLLGVFLANTAIPYEDSVFMCSAPLTNMTEKYLELRYVRNGKFQSYRFKSPEPPNEDYGLRLTLYENRSRLPEKEFYLTIHNGGVSDNTPDLVFLFRIYKEKIELLSTDEYNDTDEKNIMVTHLFPESINDKKIIIKSEHIPQEWGNAVKLQEKQISLVY